MKSKLYTTAFAILFTTLLCENIYAQLPVVNGWTQFSPSTDSRIIYVSSVSGNDATGQIYSSGSIQIGSDPFNPSGTIMAYQTVGGARAQLRNGFPDWILFKRGETWTNQTIGVTSLYGKNKNEPILIGAYGPSSPRPIILTGNQGFIDLSGSSASYLAFVGLQFEPHTRLGSDEPVCLRIISAPFNHITIEDCFMSKYFQPIALHDPILPAYPTRSNLTVRRCVIADAYVTTSSHANAMFIANVDTILFEDNLLDHNGWSSTISGANTTGFRHNSYFQTSCRNLIFRQNIVSRAAATGGGHRCGGIVTNNLYLSNPKNLQFGTHETTINWPTDYVFGEVAYNVLLDGRTESFEQGTGIQVQRAKNTTVHHNIVAHFTPGSAYNSGILLNETENVKVKNNIVYKWGNNKPSGPEYSSGILIGSSLLGTNYVDSNDVQMENLKGYCITKYGAFTNISFSTNRYNNVATSGNWFEPGGTFSNWTAQSVETGGVVLNVQYLDPERNISTYLTTIGQTGGLNEFLQLRRQLSKKNWDDVYTAAKVNNYIREGFGLPAPLSLPIKSIKMNAITVYPNPASELIHVNSPYNSTLIKLYNQTGQLIYNKESKETSTAIDIKNLPAGFYIIQTVSDIGKIWNGKIIKN